MAKTAVANKKNTDVSADLYDDFMDDAGEGTHYDREELLIPFIRLAQALSPQINKNKPEFIKGLDQGDAFNNVTGDIFDGKEGVVVVPCYQTTVWLEFVPRDSGGGFVGELDPNDPRVANAVRDGGKEILDNGNELVKSDHHYCLIVTDDGMFAPVVVDMKSTQLKVSRRWKTMIAMKKIKHPKTGKLITPPLFSGLWRLTSVEESNEKGDFYNWSVAPEGMLEDRDIYDAAKAFRESVMAGEAKAVAEDHGEDNSGAATGGGAGQGPDDDFDVF